MKTKELISKIMLSVGVIVAAYAASNAQVEGLWAIKHVSVGDQTMTPVAKWTKIDDNGTYQSGNGWLQNSIGTWTYDESSNHFTPEVVNGLKDEFGGFAVNFEDEKMIWERMENGQKVIVTLEPIKKLPMGPVDKISGLWDLESFLKNDTDITNAVDPENKQYLLMRWDRLYIQNEDEGQRSTGFWFIHAHRPNEIELIKHGEILKSEKWHIAFDGDKMTWEGMSDGNKDIRKVFGRLEEFPGE